MTNDYFEEIMEGIASAATEIIHIFTYQILFLLKY
jgi:hypothetical protein